ncbi:hypothetical protein HDR66_01660 [bacterium]|nr:hypothetical protein [bacterium]
MKMNPADVFKLVNVLADAVAEFMFKTSDGKYFTDDIPTDVSLNDGIFLLTIKAIESPVDVAMALWACGFRDAKVCSIDDKDAVTFPVGANGDDVRAIMDAMMVQKGYNNGMAELSNLVEGTDILLRQIGRMRPGMFHRGVNALKNATVEVKTVKDFFNKQRFAFGGSGHIGRYKQR